MGVSRMPAGEQYVTARGGADRVGLSSDTILRYYRDGKIPGRRMPGQIRPVRFLWSEVEAAFNGIADHAAVDARREGAGRLGGRGAWGRSAGRSSAPRTGCGRSGTAARSGCGRRRRASALAVKLA